jgi:hypothetical protein
MTPGKKKNRTLDPKQTYFFDEPPQYLKEDPAFKPFDYPVWTRNKARLVQRYLRYFVFITRHGSYIDGFAGPQEPDKLETWTAGLVFDSQPKWLRHFFLCELDSKKIPALRDLESRANASHDTPKRKVQVLEGDFNVGVQQVLASGISPTPKRPSVFSTNAPSSVIGRQSSPWPGTNPPARSSSSISWAQDGSTEPSPASKSNRTSA